MDTSCLQELEAVEAKFRHFRITETMWKSSGLITRNNLNKFSVVFITKCKRALLA